MQLESGNEPLFEQIVKKIRRYIDAGVYQVGEKLPSVREFALAIGVNPKTVVRAYEVLEAEGVLLSLNKKGYFVQEATNDKKARAREHFSEAVRLAGKTLSAEEMKRVITEWEETQND